MSRGDCGESRVTIERDGRTMELTVSRVEGTNRRPVLRDRPGETFQMLSPEVAYIKLSSIRRKDVAGYMRKAAGTSGLVIDIRNYPSEFVVFEIGSRLVRKSTPFARFTRGDLDNPGAFIWDQSTSLQPATPAYEGEIAILVDEVSISQAEYTAMALRAAPGAVVVGSTTAGADGNVSQITLPGGLRTMISGIGVFYPDKTPTQRVGIIPDIVARPTIEGIQEGRDEVLEAALRHLLPDADEDTIRRLARH
jgi:C-terminal processing protease CtpA/Prc